MGRSPGTTAGDSNPHSYPQPVHAGRDWSFALPPGWFRLGGTALTCDDDDLESCERASPAHPEVAGRRRLVRGDANNGPPNEQGVVHKRLSVQRCGAACRHRLANAGRRPAVYLGAHNGLTGLPPAAYRDPAGPWWCRPRSSTALEGHRHSPALICRPDPTTGRGRNHAFATHQPFESETSEQADVPAEQPAPGQDARVPAAHAHPRWSRHSRCPPVQGPHAAVCLTSGRVAGDPEHRCLPPATACGGPRTSPLPFAAGVEARGASLLPSTSLRRRSPGLPRPQLCQSWDSS